jgi:hypothetical protein
MAAVAIDLDLSLGLTTALQMAEESRVIRKIRCRNVHSRRWRQPSISLRRIESSRSTVRAEAIADELYGRALAPEEFWANDAHLEASTYEVERQLVDADEIEERHSDLLQTIECELIDDALQHIECDRLARLECLIRGLQFERLFATTPREYEEFSLRLEAAEIEREIFVLELAVLAQYAA